MIKLNRLACAMFMAAISLMAAKVVSAADIALQTNFPPLFTADAPRGGAHPLGGPTNYFITTANAGLAPFDRQIIYHVSGKVPPTDKGRVRGPVVALKAKFETIYAAVAAGMAHGGLDMGVGISNQNGLSFGELHVAALPFGLEADEFASYLYEGGGLALQQELYDVHFNKNLIVLPIAITPTQGGGWFPEPLPDPDTDRSLSAAGAMASLCRKPWIVRWPEPGAGIWRKACETVGAPALVIGAKTRCADPRADCPSANNPAINAVDRLAFGGFVPGIPPHIFLKTGNIDSYELNLPYTEVHMIKSALGMAARSDSDADLTPVIKRSPYYYGQTWHQPVTYLELLINRTFWEALNDTERWIIRSATQSATLRNWTNSLALQGRGIELLRENGAIVLRWPKGLLERLRQAADTYLDEKADRLARQGDTDYRRVLRHMRSFQEAQKFYADFGDINQGRAYIPTSPAKYQNDDRH